MKARKRVWEIFQDSNKNTKSFIIPTMCVSFESCKPSHYTYTVDLLSSSLLRKAPGLKMWRQHSLKFRRDIFHRVFFHLPLARIGCWSSLTLNKSHCRATCQDCQFRETNRTDQASLVRKLKENSLITAMWRHIFEHLRNSTSLRDTIGYFT